MDRTPKRATCDDSRENKAKECDNLFQCVFGSVPNTAHKYSAQKKQHRILVQKINSAAASQHENCRAFYRDACESSRSPRTGVDVDAVAANIRMIHRRMAMHDQLAMI